MLLSWRKGRKQVIIPELRTPTSQLMVTNSWQYYLIPSLSEQLCCSLVRLQISYI